MCNVAALLCAQGAAGEPGEVGAAGSKVRLIDTLKQHNSEGLMWRWTGGQCQ